MRNIKIVSSACKVLSNTIVNDVCLDKFSGNLWIASAGLIGRFQLDYEFESFYVDECVFRIVYVNSSTVCAQCSTSLLLLHNSGQV